MHELQDKIKKSIDRLKAFEPEEPYWCAFSGGKDSVAIKALLDMSGCSYEAHYSVTSVDPPELVRFIKGKYPDVHRDIPCYANHRGEEWAGKPITMWNLIRWKLIPPTRLTRYCCQYLKETSSHGKMTVTGVRWAESKRRSDTQGVVTFYRGSRKSRFSESPDFRQTKNGGTVLVNDNDESRRIVEQCYKNHTTTLNPIIDWTDNDVWNFIRGEDIPYCELYDCGFSRLGCVLCPMAGRRERERERGSILAKNQRTVSQEF